MIILGFDGCAHFMRWSHVVQIIRTTEFESTDMFCNPALAHTVNLAVAQHADSARSLPYPKPSMRGKFPPDRCSHILNRNKRHRTPPSQIGWRRRAITVLNASAIVVEKVNHLLEKTLPFETQGLAGHDETGELALTIHIGRNQAHLHT